MVVFRSPVKFHGMAGDNATNVFDSANRVAGWQVGYLVSSREPSLCIAQAQGQPGNQDGLFCPATQPRRRRRRIRLRVFPQVIILA
jgi:hypothetical protein